MTKYIIMVIAALTIGACTIRPGTPGATGAGITIKPGVPVAPLDRGDGERGQVQVDGFKDPV